MVVVFALTHWPRLTLPETGLERTDLYVHLLVFGGWTVLLNLTGYLGPFGSGRAIARCALAAALYVGVDEGTQAIPFIHRDARWDDLAANLTGVALGTIGVLIWARLASRRSPPA